MSSSETSPTRGISNWWKNFKKHSNLSNDSFESSINSIDDRLGGNSSRPSLNFKSRSLGVVRPNDKENNEQIIRQQRDEFMASQNRFGFGNEVFGVPLEDSIKVAESLISVPSDDPKEFIKYGKIPLLVGKCGSFLKERGLKVEGIFRVAGASRRVKELQFVFSTGPDYGRKLNWEGYTVHDAASLIRRFLNNLPEPLVPLELYEEFREPVKSRPRILNHIKARNGAVEKKIRSLQQQPSESNTETESEEKTELQKQKDARKQKRIAKDLRNALKEYRLLIDRLPQSQKHLLYYLLDMLTMFTDNSKDNLMPARNLAAIFQPSILSHPDHDLTPDEYTLSQAVVEVLIEYSKRLLPDVKRFVSESKRSSVVKSLESDSNKNSSVNLLAVRNSAKGSRPHSRSLSSANGIPDTFSSAVGDEPEPEHEDQHEDAVTTDEEEGTSYKPLEIPTITKTTSAEAKPILFRDIEPTKRPVSMFPGSLMPSSSGSEEFERTARSPPPFGTEGDDFTLGTSLGSKKGSWFKRLRSTSRSNES